MNQAAEKTSLKTLAETSPKYLTDEMIPFKIGPDVTASVKEYLAACREVLIRKMEEGSPMDRVVRLQSLMTDRMVVDIYKHAFEQSQAEGVLPVPLALFALGGYGRAELNLFSDIDLLFLYEGKAGTRLEAITKKMLYPFWDAGLELGYSIRTMGDCKKVMKEDIRAMSSMLDSRFLVGDRELAAKFLEFLESKFASSRALSQFVEAKSKETEERLKRFGSSVYMLEPNLKESEGGLRDWHLLRYYSRIALKTPAISEWVRRELINEEEADTLRRALDFLWAVRNRLHVKAGRCIDQLTFEVQEPIAAEMGFKDSESSRGVEKFRQCYYTHAAGLHRLLLEVTRRLLKPPDSLLQLIKKRLKTSLSDHYYNIDDVVVPRDYAELEKNPVEFLRAFHLAQFQKLSINEDLKSFIGRHLYLVDDAYRRNPEVNAMMKEMFSDLGGIGKSLKEMHDCRFLGAIMPEFGDILFQTQHDVYHIYTVDTHSIYAVNELSKLKNGEYDEAFPLFKQTMLEVKRSDLLAFSVLFHDIGKGKGGNHSEKGAEIAQNVLKRMGYPDADIAEVEFQVRSHLLMPHLSQRRDLEDYNLISAFARSMETLDRLGMLFVLTWADIRAVGPDVWTPWKGNLLQDLYMKTRRVIESGDFSPERALTLMKQAKQKILGMAGESDTQALKEYLDGMPPRYFLANSATVILSHFETVQHRPADGFLLTSQNDLGERVNRILIYTVNTQRLFEQVTGVMAANQVNILAFEQFFSSKGEALLLLKVTDHRGLPIEEERKIETLRRDLREVVQGKIPMERYSQLHQGQLYLGRRPAGGRPPRVEVDNDVSAYYTVIDVYANDRVGILHDIARVIRSLGLYIEVSKISTKVDQVADVFYVKDIFGHKITDSRKIQGIKKALLDGLAEAPKEAAGV